jgi:hypothetical protein
MMISGDNNVENFGLKNTGNPGVNPDCMILRNFFLSRDTRTGERKIKTGFK